jgi:4-diphosphocytidyl-2-C-methyl-D-erythritol kinase
MVGKVKKVFLLQNWHLCRMVVFPNAKINLGLEILRKREDGYHDIDSVFFPVGLKDVLEIVPSQSSADEWHFSGFPIPGRTSENLCVRLLKRLREKTIIVPPLSCFLHKAIPMGAGLGGGSADASFFLKALNQQFDLHLSDTNLEEMALEVGSDCPFFIRNTPMRAEGRGELLSEIEVDLKGCHLLLVCPDVHISTAAAYANVTPEEVEISPADIVKRPIEEWKGSLRNRFEEYALAEYSELAELKQRLYDQGAVYASMSGSGSAFYAIFQSEVDKSKFSNFGDVHQIQL